MFTSLNLFDKYNDNNIPNCPIYCGIEHIHKGEDMNNRMEYDKGDVYDIFEEKSKSFDDAITSLNEQGLGGDFLMSLAMGSVGGGIKINSLSEAFKLAYKFKGLANIPAYLRSPWAKSKGFRKTGITEGKATKNDPLFKALERFDEKGQKIPKSRTIDFLLDPKK